MKITAIKEQVKKSGRASIYVDNEFFAGVNLDIVLKLGLYIGKVIEKVEMEKILAEEEYSRALAKAFDYLSRRRQSEREIWQKLTKKEFSKKVIYRVVSRLKELTYLDDYVFAKTWVEDRSSNRGNHLLTQELKIKGISEDIIRQVLVCDEEVLFENALSIVRKRYKDKINLFSDEDRYKKISGLLSRRGYNYDIIKKVLANL